MKNVDDDLEVSKNKLKLNFAWFRSDLIDPTEQTLRCSKNYVEDFANMEKAKMA